MNPTSCAKSLRMANDSLADKEEKLRHLQLLVRFAENPKMAEIETLTNKWKSAAQQALCELQGLYDGTNKVELLNMFGIDPQIIGISADNS
ncbi:hypothetical protein P879_06480 [Paragonimus westermani]|uniref:Swi5-dependent recombination DNA repair protein 1 homolog n=1 Tax=Paragonimus westermani TaxID=34504 RepID=A0A8T0D149_9TREM|nr:hypothetical protein P879_06480 [Paragonimus westermani]